MHFAYPGEQVGHQSHARLREIARRFTQIRRPHSHVGIADQDDVVLAMRFHRGQALDLGIEPKRRTANDEPGIVFGKLSLQLMDHLDGRVVRVGDAKEQLVARVVELEKAPQVQLELFVESLERFENRDGRRVVARLDGVRVTQNTQTIPPRVETTPTTATRPSNRLAPSAADIDKPPRRHWPPRSPGESAFLWTLTVREWLGPQVIVIVRHRSRHIRSGDSGRMRSSIEPWQHGQICG